MSYPLVSVAIITYNQEQYIEKALNSVLNQNCSFEYEIVVGDDCSTDSTSEICKRYAKKFHKIKHIYNKHNLGYIKNLLNVIETCRGEYIAILEADDYWVSPNKLADQVAVFKNIPSTSLCFTNSLVDDIYVPEHTQYFYRDQDKIYSIQDCLTHCVAPTSTFMFVKDLFDPPKWFLNLASYEYFLIYLLADKGNIYYLNKITACRTQHYVGQSTTTVTQDKMMFSEIKYLSFYINNISKENRRKVINIIIKNQVSNLSGFLNKGRADLVAQLLYQVHIYKLKTDVHAIRILISYIKLIMKYYLKRYQVLFST